MKRVEKEGRREDRRRGSKGNKGGREKKGGGRRGEEGRLRLIPQENNSLTMVNK